MFYDSTIVSFTPWTRSKMKNRGKLNVLLYYQHGATTVHFYLFIMFIIYFI